MGTTNRSAILGKLAAMIGISMGQMEKAARIPAPRPERVNLHSGHRRFGHNGRWGGNKSGKYAGMAPFSGKQEIARRKAKRGCA